MLPCGPARQACKTELAEGSRSLQEQDQGRARPYSSPPPPPTSLGLDCNQQGGPSPTARALPPQGPLLGGCLSDPPYSLPP